MSTTRRVAMMRGVLVLALVLGMGLLGFGSGAAGNHKTFAQTEEVTIPGYTVLAIVDGKAVVVPEGTPDGLEELTAFVMDIPAPAAAPVVSPVTEEQIVVEETGLVLPDGTYLPPEMLPALGITDYDLMVYLGLGAVLPGESAASLEPQISPGAEEQIVVEQTGLLLDGVYVPPEDFPLLGEILGYDVLASLLGYETPLPAAASAPSDTGMAVPEIAPTPEEQIMAEEMGDVTGYDFLGY